MILYYETNINTKQIQSARSVSTSRASSSVSNTKPNLKSQAELDERARERKERINLARKLAEERVLRRNEEKETKRQSL